MALPIINAPKYTMTVPSSGETVQFRPYLVKEEKILMMAMESQDDIQVMRAIVTAINSCTDGALHEKNLTPFDLEYVFMQLRSKSVGETTTIRIKCEECEEYNELTVNLAAIEAPVMKGEKDLLIKIQNDLSIQMKYPSVADAMDTMTANRKEGNESNIGQMFETLAASMDVIYYGDETLYVKDYSKKEIMDFIESMSSQQFEKLTSYISEVPAIKAHLTFDCEKCGHHNDRVIKGLQNFFS